MCLAIISRIACQPKLVYLFLIPSIYIERIKGYVAELSLTSDGGIMSFISRFGQFQSTKGKKRNDF